MGMFNSTARRSGLYTEEVPVCIARIPRAASCRTAAPSP